MKKVLVLGLGLLGGIFVGTIAGNSQRTVINADSEIFAYPCEDDECEGGTDCEDNPDGNTGCDIIGTIGEPKCKTYGCE